MAVVERTHGGDEAGAHSRLTNGVGGLGIDQRQRGPAERTVERLQIGADRLQVRGDGGRVAPCDRAGGPAAGHVQRPVLQRAQGAQRQLAIEARPLQQADRDLRGRDQVVGGEGRGRVVERLAVVGQRERNHAQLHGERVADIRVAGDGGVGALELVASQLGPDRLHGMHAGGRPGRRVERVYRGGAGEVDHRRLGVELGSQRSADPLDLGVRGRDQQSLGSRPGRAAARVRTAARR